MSQWRTTRVALLFGAACGIGMALALRLFHISFGWPFWVLLAYFTVLTALLLPWQEAAASETKRFIRRFMAGLVAKLLGSLAVLFVLLLVAPEELRSPVSVAFALLYLACLTFGTARLFVRLRRTAAA
jgi:FlaA1/EpsC-like NDP-sugar epimerase